MKRLPMNRAAIATVLLLITAVPAAAAVSGGNDTGGIIAWSPQAENGARADAAAHCAGYGKFARITGIRRQYGNYISFNCLWRPGIARYSLPEVRTRAWRTVTRPSAVIRARY